MAKDLNKVQLTGRLGADPEMRFTPQGHAVTTFRVASNRAWRSSEGAQHEDTEWFRVVAWNKLAEICNQWLLKGTHVYVEGRMQTRQWQDQEGQNRYLSEVIASDIIILEPRRDQAHLPTNADDISLDMPPEEIALPDPPLPQSRRAAPRTTPARAARASAISHSNATLEDDDLPF